MATARSNATELRHGLLSNSLALGMNADGKPDHRRQITQGQRTVSVLLGNGNGTFRRTDLRHGQIPGSLTMGCEQGRQARRTSPSSTLVSDDSVISVLLGNSNWRSSATDLRHGQISVFGDDGGCERRQRSRTSPSAAVIMATRQACWAMATARFKRQTFRTGGGWRGALGISSNKDPAGPDLATAYAMLLGNGNGTRFQTRQTIRTWWPGR
jgi:hypothetical protein